MKKQYTGWKAKVAEKFSAAYPAGDERTAQVNNQGLAACGGVAILYCIGRLLWVGFRGGLAVPELVLLLFFGLVLAGTSRQNHVTTVPSVLGQQLDPAPAARRKRIVLYLLDGVVFAAVYILLDRVGLFHFAKDALPDLLIQAVCILICTFLLNFLLCERKVKAYTAAQASLDADENDLS